MARKFATRVWALLLAAVMLIGLVGCGEKTPTETTAGNKETNAPESTSGSGETQEPTTEAPVEITYPLESDYTIWLWGINNLKYQSVYNDASESPFHTGLTRMTGMNIKWEFPQDGVKADQAFSLIMMEEKKPDVIFHSIYPDAAEEYIADGVLYDLTEYLPKYAPDYWEYITSDPAIDAMAKTATGKYYRFLTCVESEYNTTYMGPLIRKDWLDEQKLDIPVTLEDWENVLKVFKEKYGATYTATKGQFGLGAGTGAYADDTALWYVDNGEVKFANTTPEYKEYLTVLNRWYAEGLMDADISVNDASAVRNKAVNGEVGIVYGPSSLFRNMVADAEKAGNGAEWIGMSHPRTAKGDATTYIQTNASFASQKGAVVTTSCSEEHLIDVLKFLNYGYTEEGRMYWNFGEKGVSYELDANGKPVWTEKVLSEGAEAYKRYQLTSGAGISIQAKAFIELLNPGAFGEAIDAWIENSVAKQHTIPRLSLTDDEAAQYNDKYTAITTYANETIAEFIFGERSLDEFDDYVKKLESMGLEDCRKVQQAAYDRYLAQ